MSIYCIACGKTTDEDGICRFCSRRYESDQRVGWIVAVVLIAALTVLLAFQLWRGL